MRRYKRLWSKGSARCLKRLIERDGPRCGICGFTVDLSLLNPFPSSASVGHIVPKCRGGSETDAVNLRVEHYDCNIRKSRRLDSELTADDKKGPRLVEDVVDYQIKAAAINGRDRRRRKPQFRLSSEQVREARLRASRKGGDVTRERWRQAHPAEAAEKDRWKNLSLSEKIKEGQRRSIKAQANLARLRVKRKFGPTSSAKSSSRGPESRKGVPKS